MKKIELLRSVSLFWDLKEEELGYISEKMIVQAKAKSKAIANLSFCTADAAVESFERNYTHVFSRFGVMFFADPTAAFSNMHSGLVSKGKLTFSCWQGLAENEWIGLSVEAIKPFQSEDAPPPDPGPVAGGGLLAPEDPGGGRPPGPRALPGRE